MQMCFQGWGMFMLLSKSNLNVLHKDSFICFVPFHPSQASDATCFLRFDPHVSFSKVFMLRFS